MMVETGESIVKNFALSPDRHQNIKHSGTSDPRNKEEIISLNCHPDNFTKFADGSNVNWGFIPQQQVGKENGENLKELQEQIDRKPVLRQILSPVIILMKVFGLYYENHVSSLTNKLNKAHCYFVVLLLLVVFVQSLLGFAYAKDMNSYYACAVKLIFIIKPLFQALSMLKICRDGKFWEFVKDTDDFLFSIKICKCSKEESKYAKFLWVWLILVGVFVIFCFIMQILMIAFPTDNFKALERSILEPLTVNTQTRIIFFFFVLVIQGPWFLPIALCAILSQGMFYLFDEFYRYMKTEKGDNGLCVLVFMQEIREKYFKLSMLSVKLDDMFNNILMISYLMDICNVCFVLRLSIYTFTTLWGRVFIMSWSIAPIFTLIALSHFASKLFDKGQKMKEYVQFFNTSTITPHAKAQLDLLLFHLNNEPVVLTIWKMVPLYRSIIISVFVTIITYFALIISLS